MKIIVHGAAKEVGRSCFEFITLDNSRFLLDAGIKLSEHGTEFPSPVKNPSEISCAFISHAHLDHTGYLPFLDHSGMKCPIISTAAAKALTKILLVDAFKIGRLKHEHLGYEKEDIDKAINFIKRVKIDEKGSINKIKFEYFDAGHIPGSAAVLVEADGKRILYTGDINTTETRLLKPAETDYPESIGVMITEATYGDRDHPNRQLAEKEFLQEIEETIERGGSAIVPVFAVGRAQEIMLMLNTANFGVPVYLDGMAKEATDIILDFPKSVKNADELMAAYKNVRLVRGQTQRRSLAKSQAIFITTSGMLTGGPVMDYLKQMYSNPRDSILLTGYQGEHTNGRMLMEERCVFIDGWRTKVSCNVKQFDFSAHSGQSDLRKLIKQVSPERLIITHGDPAAVKSMQEWADTLDINAYAPELGESIII